MGELERIIYEALPASAPALIKSFRMADAQVYNALSRLKKLGVVEAEYVRRDRRRGPWAVYRRKG